MDGNVKSERGTRPAAAGLLDFARGTLLEAAGQAVGEATAVDINADTNNSKTPMLTSGWKRATLGIVDGRTWSSTWSTAACCPVALSPCPPPRREPAGTGERQIVSPLSLVPVTTQRESLVPITTQR